MMFVVFALAVFIAGILTFLAPCTLPVLPAYLAFATRRDEKGGSTVMRTLAFGIGVAAVFVILGVLVGGLGGLIARNKRLIEIVSGALLLALAALLLAGKGLPGITINNRPSHSFFGVMGFGAIFALSWSGCIGPILGLVLILAANAQTAISGALLLLIYAMGLLLPLFAVSAYLDRLPKDGRIWRALKGKRVAFGAWETHTTTLITAAMLIIIGLLFLFDAGAWLAQSPFIDNVFDWQQTVSAALNATG